MLDFVQALISSQLIQTILYTTRTQKKIKYHYLIKYYYFWKKAFRYKNNRGSVISFDVVDYWITDS